MSTLSLIFSSIAFSPSASATSLNITANVNEIISLSVSSNLISFDLTPTPSGTFSTGSSNITVSTSNRSGYSLYLTSSGQDKSGNYTNGLIHANNKSGSTGSPVDSTNIINTLSSAVVVPFTTTKDSESSPATVSYNDSAFPTNSWGYNTIDLGNSESPKTDPTTTPGNYNATFNPIPEHSVTNTTIKTTEAPGQSDVTKLITGSKVDTSILSGAYSNTITLTAVANPVPYTYTISYNTNGGTNPPEDTTMVRIDEYTATLTITEDQPEREGYVFAGWARENNASSPEYCNPAIQGVCTNTITLDYDRPTLTLYALWQKNYNYELQYAGGQGQGETVTNLPQTQTVTSTGNGVFTIPSTVPSRSGYFFLGWNDGVNDYSPGDTYTITPSDETDLVVKTLTAQWTNESMQSFDNCASLTKGEVHYLGDTRDNKVYKVAKLEDDNCWMVEDLKLDGYDSETGTDRILTSADSNVTTPFTLLRENAGAWCITQDATCYNQSLMIKTGVPNGYLYNWYAATAGSGTYDVATDGQNVTTSICPKGWTLPTGGPNSQFTALSQAYGGLADNQTGQQTAISNLMATPTPAFNWTGYRYGGSIYNPSDRAGYWSRTASSVSAYDLEFGAYGGLAPQNNSSKVYGFAVRCIYQGQPMQNFVPDANAAKGTTKDLVDLRDGKTYKVAKLEDNNWWMVEDLKLDGLDQATGTDRVLTSADSNVTTPFTLLRENTGTWCTTQDATCYNQSLMIKTGVPNGYLYNWYAATAGAGGYDTTGAVTSSICPKGWTLPTGGPSSQFTALSQAYGGPTTNQDNQQTAISNLRATPTPAFNWTGYRYGGSIRNPSDNARYWSRTANSSVYAYNLYFTYGRLYPQNYGSKFSGFAVRCVSRTQ